MAASKTGIIQRDIRCRHRFHIRILSSASCPDWFCCIWTSSVLAAWPHVSETYFGPDLCCNTYQTPRRRSNRGKNVTFIGLVLGMRRYGTFQPIPNLVDSRYDKQTTREHGANKYSGLSSATDFGGASLSADTRMSADTDVEPMYLCVPN